MSAFGIEIKKYCENENQIIYRVDDVFNNHSFYASIEPSNNLIKIYEICDQQKVVMCIDYSDPEKALGPAPKGYDFQTIVRVFARLYKAALAGEFPENLSYIA